MSFFLDEGATDEIESINLGEVWDGESVGRVVYMRNNEEHYARDISFTVADPGLVVEGPDTMLPGEVAILKLLWTTEPGAELSLRSGIEARAVLLLRAP